MSSRVFGCVDGTSGTGIWLHEDDLDEFGCPGDKREVVEALCRRPFIRRQLDGLGEEEIRAALSGYGAWDMADLEDDEENRERFVWLAAENAAEDRRGANDD